MKQNPNRFRDRVCCPINLPFQLPPTPDGVEISPDTILVITQDPRHDDDDGQDWTQCLAIVEVGDSTWRLPFLAPYSWLLGLVPLQYLNEVPDTAEQLFNPSSGLMSDYEYWACRFSLLVERWSDGETPLEATCEALIECSASLCSPNLEMVESFLHGLNSMDSEDETALVDEVLELFISVLASMDEVF